MFTPKTFVSRIISSSISQLQSLNNDTSQQYKLLGDLSACSGFLLYILLMLTFMHTRGSSLESVAKQIGASEVENISNLEKLSKSQFPSNQFVLSTIGALAVLLLAACGVSYEREEQSQDQGQAMSRGQAVALKTVIAALIISCSLAAVIMISGPFSARVRTWRMAERKLSAPFAQYMLSHFAEIDTNGNSILSQEELQAPGFSPALSYADTHIRTIGHEVEYHCAPSSTGPVHMSTYGISKADLRAYSQGK